MKNFVFLGDSITDAGRLWLPEYNGLGNGYVKILSEKLSDKFSVINKGHGSFTLPLSPAEPDHRLPLPLSRRRLHPHWHQRRRRRQKYKKKPPGSGVRIQLRYSDPKAS